MFGGLLGNTFNYVFEKQLTDLQNGDRLYYLARTPGMNLRTQLEGNSFAELVMRNTDAHTPEGRPVRHGRLQVRAGRLVTPAHSGLITAPTRSNDDPLSECDENAVLIRMPNGQFRYRADQLGRPARHQRPVASTTAPAPASTACSAATTTTPSSATRATTPSRAATVPTWRSAATATTSSPTSAATTSRRVVPATTPSTPGPACDILMAGEGNDFTNGGANINETFAGDGNDFVIAGQGLDAVFGDTGDDWIEGGDQPDLLQGDTGNLFFNDRATCPATTS